jgi:hypothetical protein
MELTFATGEMFRFEEATIIRIFDACSHMVRI